MKSQLIKFIYGTQDPAKPRHAKHVPHFHKIRNVWESSHYYDFGIERVFRLFLVTSKIFFPGIYFEYLSKNSSNHQREITGELYVVFKTIFPFVILYYSLWDHSWLYFLNIYLLIETFVYVFNKIFLPEHNQYKTHNRSLILLFFNFIEVIAGFAVIYAAGNFLNRPVASWLDALYFSLITGATVGYGDLHPINDNGKLVVMLQIVSTLSFLILFFNYFAPRAQDIGDGN